MFHQQDSRCDRHRPWRTFAAFAVVLSVAACDGSATVVELSVSGDLSSGDTLQLDVFWNGNDVQREYATSELEGTIALWFPRDASGAVELVASLRSGATVVGGGSTVVVLAGARRITVDLMVSAGGGGSDAGTDATMPVEDCTDGTDNDGDGDVDCADADCEVVPGCPGAIGIPFAMEPAGGTAVPLGCDDCTTGFVPIGFDFVFFGVTYAGANISSNGFIAFEDPVNSGCCDGWLLPADDQVNNVIAAAWEDLDPTNMDITYETRGVAPDRRFVVTFLDVSNFVGSVTTQIILYEGTNVIEVHTANHSAGQDATQGVENADGSEAYFLPGRVATPFGLINDGVRFVTF